MAARKGIIDCPSWRPRSKLTSEIQIHLCGSLFTLDKELLSLKSSKISKIIQNNPQADLSILLRDIPADQETMELVGRFCHGFQISLSTYNAIRVACVAHYLGMTDTHCPNNLLTLALSFIEQHVVPSWANSIKALKSAQQILQPALHLGLVDYCIESVVSKALQNPSLLGKPVNYPRLTSDIDNDDDDDDVDDDVSKSRTSARRNLFDVDWKSEDLTSLSLNLYAPTVHALIQRQAPHEHVAASVCQYARTWLFDVAENEIPANETNARREIVETLVSILPNETYLVPSDFLSKMLKFAIVLDACDECKSGLESRLGKQLGRASVNDLLIPSRGYAQDEKYDTECVRRILKNFYCSYVGPDTGLLTSVAELMDEFLAEVASDIDLRTEAFLEVADMAVAVAAGTNRTSDGIYRAVDVYLEKHGHLTESEREKVCRVLNCGRMSAEACEHAARNERLPVRVVVQVLFVVQLRLREAMPREEEGKGVVVVGRGEGGVKAEMERMGSKVSELERECWVMRREMERGRDDGKRKRMNVWREMKRKLGCVSDSMHECNCHVKRKKVHPR